MIQSRFLRTICLMAGILLTCTSLALTWSFGIKIGFPVALALTCVSFISAFIWLILYEVAQSRGHAPFARGVLVVGVVLAVIISSMDILTNISTAGLQRSVDVHSVSMVREEKVDAGRTAADLARQQKFLEERVEILSSGDGFRTLHPASAYPAMIEIAQGKVERERARGGCGRVCEGLVVQLNELVANKAVADENASVREELTRTTAALAKTRAQVHSIKDSVSATANQNERLGSLVMLVSGNGLQQPNETTMFAIDQLVVVVIGIAITLSSQFFNVLGLATPSASGRAPETDSLLRPNGGGEVFLSGLHSLSGGPFKPVLVAGANPMPSPDATRGSASLLTGRTSNPLPIRTSNSIPTRAAWCYGPSMLRARSGEEAMAA